MVMDHAGVIVGVKDRQHTALEAAAREARRRGVGLTVLHAYGVRLEPEAAFVADEIIAAAHAHGEQVAAEAVQHLQPLTSGLVVESAVVRAEATRQLVDRSADAELVVVGADGRRFRDRLVGASVARVVSASAACPVLVVPEQPEAWREGAPVVVAIDVETSGPGPMHFALEEASRAQAELIVVHARDEFASVGAGRLGERRMRDLVADWQSRFPSVSIRLRAGRGTEAELTVKETATASVVVVGRERQRSLLALRTPTASFVLKHAEGPVAVVPDGYGSAGA